MRWLLLFAIFPEPLAALAWWMWGPAPALAALMFVGATRTVTLQLMTDDA